MNNRYFEQAEQFFKPMSDIMALNAKTFEALAEKQTGLMADVWNDGLSFAKDLSDKRDFESFYTSQKDFWESLNQKFSSTAQDSYALLTETQEKMSELVQDSIGNVDFSSAAQPFMQGAQQAQEAASHGAEQAQRAASHGAEQAHDTAQSTAKSASKAAQKTQSQTSKAASKTGQGGSSQSGSSHS